MLHSVLAVFSLTVMTIADDAPGQKFTKKTLVSANPIKICILLYFGMHNSFLH